MAKSISRLRNQLVQIHREVRDAQRSQFKYLKTKPRRREYVRRLKQAGEDRASAQDIRQQQMIELNTPEGYINLADIRKVAAGDFDSAVESTDDELDLT